MAGSKEDREALRKAHKARKKRNMIVGAVLIGVAGVALAVGAGLVMFQGAKSQLVELRISQFVEAWNKGKITEAQDLYMYKKKKGAVRGFEDLIAFIKKRRPDAPEPYRIVLESVVKDRPTGAKKARAVFVLEADMNREERILISTNWTRRAGYGWYIRSWGAKVAK
jgi:hypothetical protein